MRQLQSDLSHTTSFDMLSVRLEKAFYSFFKTKISVIHLFTNGEKTELQKFFEKIGSEKVFINDVVFIEENKNKFDKDILVQEIPEDIFIIFPLFQNEVNRGVLMVGSKPF